MPSDLRSEPTRGKHIAFTGIDGAGKSTHAGKLAYFIRRKYGPTYLSEPRTDLISKLLDALAWQHGAVGRREYFGHHAVDFSKAFDVVREYYSTLAPLVATGMHVVEPRSTHCRTATALALSGIRDVKMEQVLAVIPAPDLTIWLDTNPEIALERIKRRGIDTEKLDTLRRFSDAYRAMPESKGWVRIDGNGTRKQAFEMVQEQVTMLFQP